MSQTAMSQTATSQTPGPQNARSGVEGSGAAPQRQAAQPLGHPAGSPRHLRVLEPRRLSAPRRRRRARLVLASVAALAVVVVFALVYLHVVLAEKQLRLDVMTATAAQEQSAYQDLRLQVTRLESPAHIISTAEGMLGMHQAKSVIYLRANPPATTAVRSAVTASSGRATKSHLAPAGDANWPLIKSELAASP